MFKGRFKKDGFAFSSYEKANLAEYMKDNEGQPFKLTPDLPESSKQRAFFEGAICPLVAFYHEGMDHRKWKDVKKVRDWLKTELNGEYVEIGGTTHKIAMTTKGGLNKGFGERVSNYLDENYAPPTDALDPEKYKHWRDTVFPFGGPDNYIDYLVEIKIL